MKDVNYKLRKAYNTALTGLTVNSIAIPVYYLQAPESENGANYIIMTSVANVDEGTKNSADTNTSMQLQITTFAEGANPGKMADDIAGAVFGIIYPTSQAVLDMSADGVQMVSTLLTDDRVINDRFGHREFVTRILTFRHNIFHR